MTGTSIVFAAEKTSPSRVVNPAVYPTNRLPIKVHLTLAPGEGNPRNSEGDFIRLKDGRWLFIYTHFTAGSGDHAHAHLAARESADGGKTWSDHDQIIVPNEGGMNVMSVSLLRLQSGEIALFYLRKNSLQDCRPVVRFSRDEAKTWSEPIDCITDEIGYYVLNNNRVIQLRNGRLVLSTALHHYQGSKLGAGEIVTYFSDDRGKTWQRSTSVLKLEKDGAPVSLMEPGVVELQPTHLLMAIRTKTGCQYLSESKDNGLTWIAPQPSEILSPEAPATLTRIPGTKDLLLIWNDRASVSEQIQPKRNPLVAAISHDEGRTWINKKIIENEPGHGYCYTAVAFEGRRVILGYCAGKTANGLDTVKISSFALEDLYR